MPEPLVPDDRILVARCRAGDASAWEMLVRRYQRLVHAIVLRAGLDEQTAADVFQTVFLRLLQNLSRIAEPDRLQAWIVTTTKREAWLQYKRSARMVSLTATEPGSSDPAAVDDGEEGALADEAPGPDETVAHWQQVAQVQRALEALDDRCQALLQILFGDEGVGYEEAARRLAVPIGSIGPTRSRCLEKLRRSIDGTTAEGRPGVSIPADPAL